MCGLTFAQAADAVLEEARRSWTTAGTLAQWRRSIDVHAAPFRDKALAKITTDDIVSGLAPLWTAKPALAGKVRKNWERVLDHPSASLGAATGRANPAAWAPALRAGLTGPVRPTRSAQLFTDLPPMMAQLRAGRGLGRVALELSVLLGVGLEQICSLRTGDLSRSDEGWSATFRLTDAGQATETIAACRPLTGRAWSLVEPLYRKGDAASATAHVFSHPKRTTTLSARGVAELSIRIFLARAERLSHPAVLRAFRAWACDRARAGMPGRDGDFADATVEAALSLRPGDDPAGGDLAQRSALEVRRLFEAWTVFLSQG